MRLALVVPRLDFGGVERVVVNLANGFREQGIDVDVLVGRSGGDMTSHLKDNIRVVDLESDRMLHAVPKLAKYLRRQQPDAIIAAMTHCSASAVAARALARINLKIVATEHSTMSKVVASSGALKYRLMPVWSRWTFNSTDHVVAVSAGAADDLSRETGIPRSRFDVIYNPVISESLFRAAAEPVNHPWLESQSPPLVLAVGRLDKSKDFPTLVRAFRLVRDRIPAHLMILGEGPERSHIESTVRDLGLTEAVVLPGFEDNPYRYMRRAGVFALSSVWEGFGVVIVEALALGRRVVATNCTYGPSEILGDGKYGILVRVGDPESMAAGLLTALQTEPADPTDHLQQFTISAAVSRYLNLICS